MHHLSRAVTYCKKLLPANPEDNLQHSGNSTSSQYNMEWVQQKIFSGRSSQSQPPKLADAEQPFCTLTEECITPKGQPNQAALWTPNKNSFNENFVPRQTMGHVIVCLIMHSLRKIHGALLVLESLWRSIVFQLLKQNAYQGNNCWHWTVPIVSGWKEKAAMWCEEEEQPLVCVFLLLSKEELSPLRLPVLQMVKWDSLCPRKSCCQRDREDVAIKAG